MPYQSRTQTKSDGGRGLDPWGRGPPPTDSKKAQKADDDSELSMESDSESESDSDDVGAAKAEDPAVANERMRQYERDRMRYYYAVVECDTVTTAQALYDLCDGSEFEQSGSVFDLRYIPDEEVFDKEPR